MATSTDAFHNFGTLQISILVEIPLLPWCYTPWMGKLTNDVFLMYLGFNTMLEEKDRSSLSASIYFNMGEVDLRS